MRERVLPFTCPALSPFELSAVLLLLYWIPASEMEEGAVLKEGPLLTQTCKIHTHLSHHISSFTPAKRTPEGKFLVAFEVYLDFSKI